MYKRIFPTELTWCFLIDLSASSLIMTFPRLLSRRGIILGNLITNFFRFRRETGFMLWPAQLPQPGKVKSTSSMLFFFTSSSFSFLKNQLRLGETKHDLNNIIWTLPKWCKHEDLWVATAAVFAWGIPQ